MRTYPARDRDEYFREVNTRREETFAVTCPCCQRDGIVYWRKLNSGMCRILLLMVATLHKLGRKHDDWVHIDEFFPGGAQKHRDWTMMRHWGLIEPQDVRTANENASGMWRVTQTGHQFARLKVRIASHGGFYENSVMGWSTTLVDALQVLGKHFNYQELMQGVT